MTKKRHNRQRWFNPPKCRHKRSVKIVDHWLKETIYGFRGFGLPMAVDFPLTEDA